MYVHIRTSTRHVRLKLHPHMYANAKRSKNTHETQCLRVGEQHSPSFAYAAYVWRTDKRYLSGVDTSKKNTFAIVLMWTYIHSGSQRITSGMLTLVRLCGECWTINFLAFVGIRLHSACLVCVCVQMWTRPKANPNKCQKMVCLAFAYTSNGSSFCWYSLVARMSFPVSEIDTFCSPTSYYRELAVSKRKKMIWYVLSTPDLFFRAKYTSTSVWLQTYFSLKYDSKLTVFGC